MKIKAKVGAYSSIVGGGVHIMDEDGHMIGQIAILCMTDALRTQEAQQSLSETIAAAINAKGEM